MTRRKKVTTWGALDERKDEDGRRNLQLTKSEKRQLEKRRLAESAAVLFLNMDKRMSWKEIAEELGIGLEQLKGLTRSEEFTNAYNALFAEVGHDPRYKAAMARMTELLPLALRRLEDVLREARPTSVNLLRAIDKVLDANAIEPNQNDGRGDLLEFLKSANLSVTQINQYQVPPEFLEAAAKYGVGAPLEGEVVDQVLGLSEPKEQSSQDE